MFINKLKFIANNNKRMFSDLNFQIIKDIKKIENDLPKNFSDVLEGDKLYAKKQWKSSLNSYSLAKNIIEKYTKKNSLETQAILRKYL